MAQQAPAFLEASHAGWARYSMCRCIHASCRFVLFLAGLCALSFTGRQRLSCRPCRSWCLHQHLHGGTRSSLAPSRRRLLLVLVCPAHTQHQCPVCCSSSQAACMLVCALGPSPSVCTGVCWHPALVTRHTVCVRHSVPTAIACHPTRFLMGLCMGLCMGAPSSPGIMHASGLAACTPRPACCGSKETGRRPCWLQVGCCMIAHSCGGGAATLKLCYCGFPGCLFLSA